MTQNTSSAVMQQRSEPHDSLDDFPTPPWATRAMVMHVLQRFYGIGKLLTLTAREPCCNRGHMADPLGEFFREVIATDIFDYGYKHQLGQLDYLYPGEMLDANVTVFNAPFKLAEQFTQRSFDTPEWMVTASLVRIAFAEGVGRYKQLFEHNPPTVMAIFSERVIMHKGILRDPDVEYLDAATGVWKKPSTATSYCWMVWIKGIKPQPPIWIPPCRKLLTRPGDYPEPPRAVPLTIEEAMKRPYRYG